MKSLRRDAFAATYFVVGDIDASWLFEGRLPHCHLTELPPLLIAFAWVSRRPSGGVLARHVWTSGRCLMLGVADKPSSEISPARN